jgi:hypothetical protein
MKYNYRYYAYNIHDLLRFIFEVVEGKFLKTCIALEDF